MSSPAAVIPQYSRDDYTNLFKNQDFNNLDINDQLKRLSTVDSTFGTWNADKYASFRQSLGVPLQGQIRQPTSLKDKVIEGVRPVADAVAGGVSGLAATPTGPLGMGAAGLGGAMLIDQALQAAEDRKPVSALTGSTGMANTVETVGMNEIGGKIGDRIIGGLGNVLKELNVPGSVVGSISKLNPTFSQMYRNTFGEGYGSDISKWVEDIFASGSKARALENSGKASMFEGTALAGRLASKRPNVVSNPDWMAPSIRTNYENNFYQSVMASNKEAATAKLVGKANPELIPLPAEPPQNNPIVKKVIDNLGGGDFTQMTPQAQQSIISMAKQLGYTPVIPKPISIEGRINIFNNTRKAAQDFLDEKMKLFPDIAKAPQEDQALMQAAQSLIRISEPIVDPNTGVATQMPVSFKDAWQFKQTTDRFGYKNSDDPNALSYTGSTFQKLSKAINQDIDESIPLWKNNPNGVATKAWQNAKTIVAQRNSLFAEDGLAQLLKETNSTVPDVDAILNDPVKLQRAIDAGVLKMSSGQVASTNVRGNLQGYKIDQMLNNAWKGDSIDSTKGVIQPEILINDWTSFGRGESKKILFNNAQTRQDIDQLFKQIAISQQKQTFGGLGGRNMWVVRGGIMLAPALMGDLTGLSEYGAGITGVMLTGNAIANIMTKGSYMGVGSPSIPRAMIAAISGAPMNRSMQTISRGIVGALQGTGAVITINTRDGKKIDGTISKDGQFVPQ